MLAAAAHRQPEGKQTPAAPLCVPNAPPDPPAGSFLTSRASPPLLSSLCFSSQRPDCGSDCTESAVDSHKTFNQRPGFSVNMCRSATGKPFVIKKCPTINKGRLVGEILQNSWLEPRINSLLSERRSLLKVWT